MITENHLTRNHNHNQDGRKARISNPQHFRFNLRPISEIKIHYNRPMQSVNKSKFPKLYEFLINQDATDEMNSLLSIGINNTESVQN